MPVRAVPWGTGPPTRPGPLIVTAVHAPGAKPATVLVAARGPTHELIVATPQPFIPTTNPCAATGPRLQTVQTNVMVHKPVEPHELCAVIDWMTMSGCV